jgi:hypothetical protein
MKEIEQKILEALVELEDAVRQMPTSNPKPNLLPIFSRIEDLTRQLPTNADPELLHFLHKKSYEKAKLLLLGRGHDAPRGSCRH